MKKFFLSILIVFMFLFTTTKTSSAVGVDRVFGGKIINSKATEIQKLEGSGWKCVVPGSSITINPIKSSYPRSYIIPTGTTSKTGTTPRVGQWAAGLFSTTKSTATCTRACPPAVCETTVILDTINFYGTSK